MVITIKNLSTGELEKVKGGGITILGSLGIAALVIFICVVIEGQIKLKWQNHKNTEFKGNFEEKPLIRIRRKD